MYLFIFFWFNLEAFDFYKERMLKILKKKNSFFIIYDIIIYFIEIKFIYYISLINQVYKLIFKFILVIY